MNLKSKWLLATLGFHVLGFIVALILYDKENNPDSDYLEN